MMDLTLLRQSFARHLLDHAASRYSLDAALLHVARQAYEQGAKDVQMPELYHDTLAHLDAILGHRVRGQVVVAAAPGGAGDLSGTSCGAGQADGTEGRGDAAMGRGPQGRADDPCDGCVNADLPHWQAPCAKCYGEEGRATGALRETVAGSAV